MVIHKIMSYTGRAALSLTLVTALSYGTVTHASENVRDRAATSDAASRSAHRAENSVGTLSPGTYQAKQIVRDLDQSAGFYGRVFGIEPAMRFKSVMNHRPMEEVLFKFPNGRYVPLVLIKFLDDGAVSHDQTVHVFFTDDIDAFIERVKENGGRVTERRDDTHHRARIAFWYDPEGNLWETVQMY